jgi:hypothetical protein
MVVDDKDIHREKRSLGAKCTSVPGLKHETDLWRISGRQYFRMIQRDGDEGAQSTAEYFGPCASTVTTKEDDDGRPLEV